MYLKGSNLLRFIEIDIFFNQIALYHGVTQGDNSEIQNAVFSTRKTSRNCKLEKRLISRSSSTSVTKKIQRTLRFFILEFDDVTAKPIYCVLSCLEWGLEGRVGGPRFVLSLLHSTHEPSLNYRKHN